MTSKDLLSLTIPGANGTSTKIETPPGIPSGIPFANIASAAIGVAMVIGIILALFYLTYGGIYWIQSKGDKEKLDKARRIILNSIFGLIIMSLAFVIVNLISSALGVETLIGK